MITMQWGSCSDPNCQALAGKLVFVSMLFDSGFVAYLRLSMLEWPFCKGVALGWSKLFDEELPGMDSDGILEKL